MPLSKQDILDIMAKAQELGLTSIEVEGFKANFGTKRVFTADVQEQAAEDIIKPMSVLDELDEEEIIYWSTPYYDELQEKKELMRKAKEEQP